MRLVDPCPGVELKIVEPDPFRNMTYLLGDPQLDQFWSIDNLISKDTLVDCGPLTVEFFNDDDIKSPYNDYIFVD